MAAKRERDPWLEHFSLVLTQDALRSMRRDPKFEAFAGSKPLAVLWLVVVATIAGALGGTLVSGALWRSLLQVPLWLAVTVAVWFAVRRPTLAMSGQPLGFLAGSCIVWGMLIGACAMWGAQLSSAGWAYGIAGGIGFLIGITHGGYEPEDLEGHDTIFTLGMVAAPTGACAGAWLHRNYFEQSATLEAAALAGAIAALIFLGPVMTFFFARLNNVNGLKRLATLLLHRDDTVKEALPALDSAIRLSPQDASLFDRRALAHGLVGNEAAAEADWTRHAELAPKNVAAQISRGWLLLRRSRPGDAAAAFEQAMGPRKRDHWASIGLGVARLRLGAAQGAIAALEAVRASAHDALSYTYLAEAHLAAGNAKQAEELATVAIDELDSIHGRSWLVRAEALKALNDIDAAAKDYNKALWAADEIGIEERAMAGLEAIGRPVEEDEPE